MNPILKKSIIILVLIVASVAIGRFTAPYKIVEKEHVVYQDRIVEKKTVDQKTEKKNNKVYVRITTIKPDGTKTTETKIYDKDQIDITQKENDNKTDNKDVDKTYEKTVEYKKNEWFFSVGAELNKPTTYGLFINKRIIGPFYLGAFGFTDKSLGASIGFSF